MDAPARRPRSLRPAYPILPPTGGDLNGPDGPMLTCAGLCLMAASVLNERAATEGWPEASILRWSDIYSEARAQVLRSCPKTDAGIAAKVAVLLSDLPSRSVRENNDLAGMAMLALAEDLIARIM